MSLVRRFLDSGARTGKKVHRLPADCTAPSAAISSAHCTLAGRRRRRCRITPRRYRSTPTAVATGITDTAGCATAIRHSRTQPARCDADHGELPAFHRPVVTTGNGHAADGQGLRHCSASAAISVAGARDRLAAPAARWVRCVSATLPTCASTTSIARPSRLHAALHRRAAHDAR
jgi:hypothetical protein